MQKWEYCHAGLAVIQIIYCQTGQRELSANIKSFDAACAFLGREGWELVFVYDGLVYFKRPL